MSDAEGLAVPDFHYVGSELDIFAEAQRWKAYWSRKIKPYIHGDAIEVGAGIGANTSLLSGMAGGRWMCLEPDQELCARLETTLKKAGNIRAHEIFCGTLESLDEREKFDTILYIDVLEHIEDDAAELRRAAARLKRGGRVIVLSPAHQFLYTPFDAAIGHFRRYDKASLRAVSPAALELEHIFYLDACGIAASAMNRMLLRQSMPTKSQLGTWDKWIIPVSRVVDPVLMHSVGKSIVGVWQRPAL
jgi:protein-L-isoaspartate O-methyltransferase